MKDCQLVSLEYSFQKAHSSTAKVCCEEMVDYALESEYAYEQLQLMAYFGEAMFIASMKGVFGWKRYHKEVVKKLFDNLVADDRSIVPKIVVLSDKNSNEYQDKSHNTIDGKINGKFAAYDNEKHEILVSYWFMCRAIYNNNKRGELLVALVEEFGHHVHYLLSEVYSTVGKGKVHGDVGAKFAAEVIGLNALEQSNQCFAKVNGVDLVWEYKALQCRLQQWVDQERQNRDDNSSERFNFYGASSEVEEIFHDHKKHGYGHHELEKKALLPILKKDYGLDDKKIETQKIVKQIYFGNWLRDYSQLVDPQAVRPLSNALVAGASAPIPFYFLVQNALNLSSGEEVKKNRTVVLTDHTGSGDKNVTIDYKIPDNGDVVNDYGISPFGMLKGSVEQIWLGAVERFDANVTQSSEVNVTHSVEATVDPTEFPFLVVEDKTSSTPKAIGEVEKDKEFMYKMLETTYRELYQKTITLHPLLWSRQFLTGCVTLLALKEFGEKRPLTQEEYENIEELLKKDFLVITPKLLGVYRPDEHIDNPKLYAPTDNSLNIKLNTPEENRENRGFVGNPEVEKGELDIGTTFGMKNYIRTDIIEEIDFSTKQSAYKRMVKKLNDAANMANKDFTNPKNSNREAMAIYGEALHILEDYFAHTNYVEVALMNLGYDHVFPWVGKVSLKDDERDNAPVTFDYNYYALLSEYGAKEYLQTTAIPVIEPKGGAFKSVAHCIPIVTGTFARVDMLSSTMPSIFKLFKESTTFKEGEFPQAGDRGYGDAFVYMMAKDIDSMINVYAGVVKDAIKDVRDAVGINKKLKLPKIPKMVDTWNEYLVHRDAFYGELNHDLEGIPVEKKKEYFRRVAEIKNKLNFGLYFLVMMAVNALDSMYDGLEEQLIVTMENPEAKGDFGIGTNPTHTHVAKDHVTNKLHKVSVELAIEAVQRVSRIMFDVWKGNSSAKFNLTKEVAEIMQHPTQTTWQNDILSSWALQNSSTICELSTPQVVIKSIVDGIKEYKEFLDKLIDATIELNGGVGTYLRGTTNTEEALKGTLNGALKDFAQLIEDIEKEKGIKRSNITLGTDLAKILNKDRDKLLDILLNKSGGSVSKITPAQKQKAKVLIQQKGTIFIDKTIEASKDIFEEDTNDMIDDFLNEYIGPTSQINLRSHIHKVEARGQSLIERAKSLYSKYQFYHRPKECNNKKGVSYVIDGFETGKSIVNTKVLDKLNRMIETEKKQKKEGGFSINIIGHADKRGERTYNQTLSEERANAVKKYLKFSKWAKGQTITTSGKGEDESLYDKYAQNRRVEITIKYHFDDEDIWLGL